MLKYIHVLISILILQQWGILLNYNTPAICCFRMEFTFGLLRMTNQLNLR